MSSIPHRVHRRMNRGVKGGAALPPPNIWRGGGNNGFAPPIFGTSLGNSPIQFVQFLVHIKSNGYLTSKNFKLV